MYKPYGVIPPIITPFDAEGHVDFAAAISKAWSLGVRRYVTEMWYTGSETWQQDIRSARQMMAELLDGQTGGAQ